MSDVSYSQYGVMGKQGLVVAASLLLKEYMNEWMSFHEVNQEAVTVALLWVRSFTVNKLYI